MNAAPFIVCAAMSLATATTLGGQHDHAFQERRRGPPPPARPTSRAAREPLAEGGVGERQAGDAGHLRRPVPLPRRGHVLLWKRWRRPRSREDADAALRDHYEAAPVGHQSAGRRGGGQPPPFGTKRAALSLPTYEEAVLSK